MSLGNSGIGTKIQFQSLPGLFFCFRPSQRIKCFFNSAIHVSLLGGIDFFGSCGGLLLGGHAAPSQSKGCQIHQGHSGTCSHQPFSTRGHAAQALLAPASSPSNLLTKAVLIIPIDYCMDMFQMVLDTLDRTSYQVPCRYSNENLLWSFL